MTQLAIAPATTDWGPFSLAGKHALITGGAMGIGFAIARRFLEAGAAVIIADADGEAAEKALTRLHDYAGRVHVTEADVSLERDCQLAVARCVDQFGSIDILVNDAGIFPVAPVLEMTPEFFDRVVSVNLRGTVFMSKTAGLHMVKQGHGGKIVNIASIDSLHPSVPGLAAYDASKGGVLMFTRSFALEMAPHGVQVNGIAPGGITTEGTSRPLEGMPAEASKQVTDAFTQRIPMKRMGTPDEIGTVAVFLASPASNYMTGSMVVVDGGMLLS